MPTPLVSVLIPAYNQAQFLRRAVESALSQTFSGFEVIVMDDGSTDGTPGVIRSFGDRVIYLHQQNAGLSAARNAALVAARGNLIALLDSDDELHPRFLEHMVEAARLEPHGSVFTGSWDEIDVAGAVTGHVDARLWPTDTFHALFNPMRLGPPCRYLFRRTAFEKAGPFDPALRACEDWDEWLRMAACGARFVSVPAACARYRVYPTSLSKNYRLMWLSGQQVLEQAARTHGDCALCRAGQRDGLARWREWCYVSMLAPPLRFQIEARDYRGAARRAVDALGGDPGLAPLLLRSARTRGYALYRAAGRYPAGH